MSPYKSIQLCTKKTRFPVLLVLDMCLCAFGSTYVWDDSCNGGRWHQQFSSTGGCWYGHGNCCWYKYTLAAAAIVLMRSRLEGVITAIDLSRSTFTQIRLNYLWALDYNVMGIPIPVRLLFPFTGNHLPPWIAGAAMEASSVSIVCCSLLLTYHKQPRKLDLLQMQAVRIQYIWNWRRFTQLRSRNRSD